MINDKRPVESLRAVASDPARTLLTELARIARQGLQQRLDPMFSACDDFFFDLASRARSNADQNRYFESLREVRLKKTRVAADFLAGVERSFSAPSQRSAPWTAAAPGDAILASDLQLVSHDQMERDVLVTDMVSRARLEWQQELFQLRERLLSVCPPFAEDENPFDPGRLTAAFTEAASAFEVELDILKILYKQFDRTVLLHLDEIYAPANQRLKDAGLLPNLTPLARRGARKQAAAPATPPAAGAAGATVTGAAGADAGVAGAGVPVAGAQAATGIGMAYIGIPDSDPETRELARVLRRLHDGGIRLPTLQSLPVAPAGPGNPALPREELVSLLSDVGPGAAASAGGAPAPPDIRQAFETIVARRGPLNLGQADEDIINVVAMFFDVILDDRNLPLEIQALVSRLQLPVLKVALKDRSFFTDRKHPARQLINEIARTSIGWESSDRDEQDALFIRLTELVEQVLEGSAEHAEVFEKCLNDLMSFISNEDSRASKLERRTREQAVAHARTAHAQEAVKTLLNERLSGTALPQDIGDFLVNDWQQVLYQRHVKHGEDSAEFREALQILDDLLWCAQAHRDAESRTRLQSMLPALRARIAAALEQAGTDVGRGGETLRQLTAILARLHAGRVTEREARPLSEEQKQRIEPTPAQKPWEEMTAVERQFVRHHQLLGEQLKRVEALETGTWVQYDDLRQGISRRCKLSAKLAATDSFVFVNRMGAKVLEKPRQSFAYDLQMGYARILDTENFFDRTLERITSNLRKLAGE